MSTTNQNLEINVIEIIAEVSKYPAADIRHYHLISDELGIDSIKILELLTCLEDKFQFELLVEDIQPEHFGSVQAIIDFVRRKLST